MDGILNWIVYLHFVIYCKTVLTSNQLAVQTHPSYLTVNWQRPAVIPSSWDILYKILGTNYHSSLSVAGFETSVNITTTEYPGAFFSIKLYTNTNGSRSLLGRGFTRAACSNEIEIHIGDTEVVESMGYPNKPITGQICTWTITGSNQTWYNVTFDDLDFGDGQSCDNYIQINDITVCDNGTLDGPLLVPSSNMSWKFVVGKAMTGKGFKANVTAVYKMEKPENVTATLVDDDVITVSWQDPLYHPPEFFYTVRVSHYPHTSHVDVWIPRNTTSYDVNVTKHAGQNFTFLVKSATQEWSSEFSDPITIQTSCDKSVYISMSQTVTITSLQYPFHYLAGVHCRYSISSSNDSFLRITVDTLDIDGGPNCVDSNVQISQLGKFCSDSPPDSVTVIPSSSTTIDFVSGETVHGKGFNMTVKAVAKPPSAPYHLRTRAEAGKIYLQWTKPLERSQFITGYLIKYSVMPTATQVTVFTSKDSTATTIRTIENNGRLFMLRVAASSEGGWSNLSEPHYARASCGSSFHLTQSMSAVVMTPTNIQHKYEPGMVCKWYISTISPLWLYVEIEQFHLELSKNCTKDYVDVTSIGRLCGSHLSRTSHVVKQTQLNVTFVSDMTREAGGFVWKITSVGPSPSEPVNVKIRKSSYALIVSWAPPILHRKYLKYYMLHYRLFDNDTIHSSRIMPQDTLHAIDTTNTPGRLFYVWVQSFGDIEPGGSANKTAARAVCGQNHLLGDNRIYITSPHYPERYPPNTECIWNIFTKTAAGIAITFLTVDLSNYHNCTDFIFVSGFGYIYDDSIENTNIAVNNTNTTQITFKSDSRGEGNGFILFVEKIYHGSVRSSIALKRSTSSASTLRPSSAMMFGTSITAIATTAMVVSNLVSSDIVSRSQFSPIDSQQRPIHSTNTESVFSQKSVTSSILRTLYPQEISMAVLPSMGKQSVQKESEEQLSPKSSILCPGRTIPNSNIEYKSSFWNITRHRTDNIVSIHSASSTHTPVNQAIGTSSTAFLQSSFMVDVPEYKETLMNTYSTIPHSFKNILEETPILHDVFTASSFSENSNMIPTLTLKNRITSTTSHSSLVTSKHSLNTQDKYSYKSEGLETYDVTEAITHEQEKENPKSKTTLVIPENGKKKQPAISRSVRNNYNIFLQIVGLFISFNMSSNM